ncbi:hypothetical protein [Vallitalea okinawensis]|uniref:hypothetical protein n=1 Tax=Vallitalea okinawensis TaxID=2078660 RepID=UPI000CFD9E9C|nr:hypothetical protein [Vallitalea okinawensis]
MSTPKIIILKMKDIIYTALFALLGIILIIVLIYMFMPGNSDSEPTIHYTPGIYTSSVILNDQVVGVNVTIYDNEIQSISFKDLDPDLSMMYPLLEETMTNINEHMEKKGDIKEVKPNDGAVETTAYIMNAVNSALTKAEIKE